MFSAESENSKSDSGKKFSFFPSERMKFSAETEDSELDSGEKQSSKAKQSRQDIRIILSAVSV